MSWSAAQYTQFEDERTRPVRDLLAQLPERRVAAVMDLGCGPGNSTELLLARYPGAAVSGLDSSADMLAAARKRLPEVEFVLGDIAVWRGPELYDVILANASLHWVPDHATLMPALMQRLAPNGVLAVQMPDNYDEPAHHLIRKVAAEGKWAAKLAAVGASREPRRQPSWYFNMLRQLGARADVWVTIYHHPLAGGASAIVEWFKGSGLRPFLDRLDDEERVEFLDRYVAEVAQAYPALADGTVLLPFPRLFFVATHG
ncbi:trans-aconitate 2-methyltransferase [Sabulicella rubraurantiaca]|uniref:trans-aconitate 2-methyltransferase n=1 Tax=Sabulicella rubraurantiaca TaxID=2811429 RepID=UPI001A96BC6B|nr:trans-aconitate 2-methyltransferase [Sabulicella rubraurantiaca]